MNVVFLSPHFPPNYYQFCVRLREAGAHVLGLADLPFEWLGPELRNSLSEYYRVTDMHNYDQLIRALGYFTHHWGKIDRIDSHNEYWLETEAALRTDFNIPGMRRDQMEKVKQKSQMKRIFREVGLRPARGRVCETPDELRQLISEVGFPVVAKPDVGVGAARTYKLTSNRDVDHFLHEKPTVDYMVEEFMESQIATFDGLVDAHGKLVFSASFLYSKGVMEAVNDDTHLYYYLVRDIDPNIEATGMKVLQAFDVRERFFHFEFFLGLHSEVIPMEVNIRPPGGLTMDMWNYCFDFDCYRIWSETIMRGKHDLITERPYYVIYIGRKDRLNYVLSYDQVLSKFHHLLVHHERMSDIFARVLGNHGYIMRNPILSPLLEAAHAIQELKP
jgi:hypothetical protein